MFKDPEKVIKKLIFNNMGEEGEPFTVVLNYGVYRLKFHANLKSTAQDAVNYFMKKIAEIEDDNVQTS